MKLFTLLAVLISSIAFASTSSYQVTGSITEIKDDVIIVQKGKEKFEVAKSAATPVDGGELAVGGKVTVYYTLAATKIEVKPAKEGKKTEKK